MSKIKIVIFGITDAILGVLRNKIDPRQAEIVAFVDNDKNKQGCLCMNIPIMPLCKTKIDKDCYVIVTALSSYEAVKEQLVQYGVNDKKIQPFIADALCEFCVGSIEDIDIEIIKKIYFEPDKAIKKVWEYTKLYNEYSRVAILKQEDCFSGNTLISHACGGVVNGKQIMYSNSKEAFLYSVENNFSLIECDVLGMERDEIVLAHDYDSFYRAKEENYSIMDIKELFLLMKKNPHIHVLIDVKWNIHKEYECYVARIDELLEEMSGTSEEQKALKSQIIMEVYDEETIRYAFERGFKMIFTQYRNPEYNCYMNTVNLCNKYGISAIAFSVRHFLENDGAKNIRTFIDKNIKIFCFSTDSLSEYRKLRDTGVSGIFTNYLTHRDIERIE